MSIGPVDRVLVRFSREQIAGFIEVAIDLLDLADSIEAAGIDSGVVQSEQEMKR